MNADKARLLARGRWGDILVSVAPAIKPAIERTGQHVACPVHGGNDGFRSFKDVNQTGGTVCNTCGSFPDGFSTLMWVNGWDFKTALQTVSDFLGEGEHQYKPIRRILDKDLERKNDEKIRFILNKTWKEAIALTETEAQPARDYLSKRGITMIPSSSVVRFHPSMPYYDGDYWVTDYPALVSIFSDTNGNPVTIHRTYLTTDGRKAPVAFPKKLMRYPGNKVLTGGAIRLSGSGFSTLAVAEGIETSLSVATGTGLPVWCLVNANLMEKFVPPDGTQKILVFADKDLPTKQHPKGHGQEASRYLVQKLWEVGIKASLVIPTGEVQPGKKSLDWNDVLLHVGKSSFQPESIFAT